MKKQLFLLVMCCLLVLLGTTVQSFATIRYVNAGVGGGTGDGLSWPNAYNNLQSALTVAVSGDQIWVAKGIYYPSANISGNTSPADPRTKTFAVKNGIAIYGGFAGNETLMAQRNIAGNVTILSGDLMQNDGQQPIVTDPITNTNVSDNAYNVVINISNNTLDGLTITAGNSNSYGGGIYNATSYLNILSPNAIARSYISTTTTDGPPPPTVPITGQLVLADPILGCGPLTNAAAVTGKIVLIDRGTCNFSDKIVNAQSAGAIAVIICNNVAGQPGSMSVAAGLTTIPAIMISLDDANLIKAQLNTGPVSASIQKIETTLHLNNCNIRGNSATTSFGGGIYSTQKLYINKSNISENYSDNGGGIAQSNNEISLTNTTIKNNRTIHQASAINIEQAGTVTLTNCEISGNTSQLTHGGILNSGSVITLTNCTVANNTSITPFGAIWTTSSGTTIIKNTLTANNSPTNFITSSGALQSQGNNIVNDGSSGFTNGVNGDKVGAAINPLFVSATNLRLQAGSPAIDAGNNAALPMDVTDLNNNGNTTEPLTGDLDLNKRVFNTTVDIGAYEYGASPLIICPTVTHLYVNQANNGGTYDGFTWATAFKTLQEALTAANNCPIITQIWVAKGTYYPTADESGNTSPADARTKTFVMKNDIAIYGGFVGNEASNYDLSLRNFVTNETILSGDIGAAGNSDNSYHVIQNTALDNSAILDGFTVTGGNASGTGDDDSGGAMRNNSSSPKLTNCTFSGNVASNFGGGIANFTSSPIVTNCVFIGNASTSYGAALFNTFSSMPIVVNCSFSGNIANVAIVNINSSFPTLRNCVIWSNSSSVGSSSSSGATITYSDVEGGFAGTGNINIDPLFVSQPPIGLGTAGNLRLQACSPAINAGDNSANNTLTDLAGNNRKFGIIDMGAYEFQGNPLTITAPTVTQPTCALPTGGIILVNATGTGTLEYSINNGTDWQTNAGFSNLAAGNYTIKVRTQGSPSCEVSYGSNPVVLNSPFTASTTTDTWTGCVSTDWATPGNWADGSVPTAADDVIIPNTANKPVIGAGTAAVAKSVIITVAAAQLTISSTATLSINSSTGFALENFGTLDNSGTIRIGNITSVANRGIVHRIGGTLNNKTGGLIQIDRTSAVEAFYTSGVVNNEATIEIGSNAAVTGNGVSVDGSGTFNNKTGGSLTINAATYIGIANGGTTNNTGTITIGNISSLTHDGIQTSGIFNNNLGGTININRTGGFGGVNNSGTFTNAGGITIGDVAIASQDDIENYGTFINATTGVISVDRAGGNGIWNIAGTFQNNGKITVGSIASTGTGILNYVPFTNSAGAEIHIDRVPNGIVSTNTFTNAGLIRIGANASLTASGINNTSSGTFRNNTGGLIQIDRTGGTQAFTTAGVVNNEATIEIGSNAAVTGTGLTIVAGTGVFNNKAGGLLTINRSTGFALENFGTLDNSGTIRIGNITSVANRGIVHRNGGTLNNKTGGLIQIDRTSAVEAFYTSGVVNNEATIEIGSNAAVTGLGLYIDSGTGIFNNKAGSLLTINRSTQWGMENKGTLDNSGTIRVGNIASVGAICIVHRNGGTFTNKTGGAIYMDRTTAGGQAFYSSGLVNNESLIKIGSNAAVGEEGIRIEGNVFNNKPSGSIQIDQTGSHGIRLLNSGTVFNNEALIEIGSNSDVKGNGIRNGNGCTFNNKIGGDIYINRIGILNTNGISCIINFGTFTNDAKITIGNGVLLYAQDGILNQGSFTNSATGITSIQKPWGNGIWHSSGTFQNVGKITISNIFYFEDGEFSTGILSTGPFTNSSGAEIHLDQVATGIATTNAFTNAGLIRMGENGPLTGSGIANIQGVNAVFNNNAEGDISIKQTAVDGVQNDALSTFNNNACAKLTIFDNLNNAGTFTNAGLFTVNTSQAHTNTGTLTNNGIIEYPQGNPIPNVTNNDVIVAPIFICGTVITPALQIGGMNSFNVGTTWYKEPALSTPAGTYSPNTFTVTNLTADNTYPLYFEITDPANMCPRKVSLSATVNAPPVVSTPQTALCTGLTMTLSPTSGGTWQSSNPSMATVTNAGLVTGIAPGVVYFTFTSDATTCSATTANVTIKPTPASNLTASKVDVCPNTEVTLNPNCSIPTSTVNWNPGAPTVTLAAATLPYVYKATCTADGCTGNESSVEVRTHRILVDMKDLDVGALPLPIFRAVKDNMEPTNQINAPVFPRRWTFIANGCNASESAVFKLSGPVNFSTIDNASTYAMFANDAGGFYSIDHPNYGNGGSFPDGTYTLTVDLRSQDGVGGPFPKNRVATGALLATRTLQFTISSPQSMVGSRQSAMDNGQWTMDSGPWTEISPNPVSDALGLKIVEAKGQSVKVSLLDASGRTLLQRSFVPETNQHREEFNVRELANGMYFLRVHTADKQETLKVIKAE